MRRKTSRVLKGSCLLVLLLVGGRGFADGASSPEESSEARNLKRALQAEFEASGAAMRDELSHAVEGDALGAALAAQTVREHRARFLDLRRRWERLTTPLTPATAEALRDPFAPDVSIRRMKVASAERVARDSSEEGGRPRWDLYSREAGGEEREGNQEAAASARPEWGMYGAHAEARVRERGGAPSLNRGAQALDEEIRAALPPERPFLVYRNPLAAHSATEP
jgi:hypothetical protein